MKQQRPVMPVIFFFACQRNANIKSSIETHRLFVPKSSWINCNFLFSSPPPYSPTPESETSLGVTGAESAQGAASARRNGMETIPFGSSFSTAFDPPFAELGVRMCACLALLREKQWSGLARWVSERERITPNRTPFVVFAPAACAPRRGALRAHHSWRPRLAESWVPVRVRWCGCRRQRSLGRFPEPSSRRSEETRQPRARRQRSSSAFVGSVRQPTGKTKLKMPLVSPSPVRPFSLLSVRLARTLARSLARSQASLSGCHSVDLESHVSLGHSSRDLSLESVLRDSVLETTSDRGCETERGCDCPSSRFPR